MNCEPATCMSHLIGFQKSLGFPTNADFYPWSWLENRQFIILLLLSCNKSFCFNIVDYKYYSPTSIYSIKLYPLLPKLHYELGLETVALFAPNTDQVRADSQTPFTPLLKKDFISTGSFTPEDFAVLAKGRVHAVCVKAVRPP